MLRPTIFALSSGQPPAGIAVVRISGLYAREALRLLTLRALPVPRRATIRTLIDPDTADVLDQALVLWLPGPDTVTGEDVVELHLHGGRAIVRAVLDCFQRMEGMEPAEPGAFTRRAFDNGRIDLSQVEGLADLLAAETEGQRRSALAMAEGRLTHVAEAWRSAVLGMSAQVEAALDFADEGDVPQQLNFTALKTPLASMQKWLEAASAERLRDGIRVVLAGPPNAGKSTLLNALAGRDAAITSVIAGTTRDIVEVPVVLDGVPFVLTDTAGLHDDSIDEIEQEGMRRAQDALSRSDIILWLGAVDDRPALGNVIMIAAQADRYAPPPANPDQIILSAVTGAGMAALRAALMQRASLLLPAPDGFAINRRQRQLIAALASELELAISQSDLLIAAEHLRQARAALDRLVGRTGVEDMLDAIFGGFCIGK